MIWEFVPGNERSEAKLILLTLEMNSVGSKAHTSHFREFVKLLQTQETAEYHFFLMPAASTFKIELTEKQGSALPGGIDESFELARCTALADSRSKEENAGEKALSES